MSVVLTDRTTLPASRRVDVVQSRVEDRRAGRVSDLDVPWKAENVLRLLAQVVIGAVGLVVAWVGASGKTSYDEQIAWLVAAILATAVGALGMVGWLVSGARTVRIERGRLQAELAASLQADGSTAEGTQEQEQELVTAPRMTRVHVRSCVLAQGKADLAAPSSDDLAVLQLCDVCLDENGRAR